MGVFLQVSMCTVCYLVLTEAREDHPGSPETSVTHSSELPRGSWKLNLGLSGEQPVLLTVVPNCTPFLCYFLFVLLWGVGMGVGV